MKPSQIHVVFVCTGNSARSQMAEALLANVGGPGFDVHSAGTHPGGVNPLTIRALGELGIDWSRARSASVAEYLDQSFNDVIPVCDQAREACPVFPGGATSLHWGFEDPAAAVGTDDERVALFRRVLDQIGARIAPFIEMARESRLPTLIAPEGPA